MATSASRTDKVIAVAALAVAAVNWVLHPLRGGLNGDFLAMLSHREAPSGYWDGQGYGYGPVFALYDLALRPFDDRTAMLVMFAFNTLLTGLMLWGLWRAFPELHGRPRAVAWLALAIASFYPYAQLVRQNNVELTEVCLLAWFVFCLRTGRDTSAGALLGLAISTKYLPLVLVAPLVWRHRLKAAIVACGVFVVMLFAVGGLKGMWPWEGFATLKKASSAGYAQSHASSQSMVAVLLRATGRYDATSDTTFVSPTSSNPVLMTRMGQGLVGLAAVLTAAWLLRRTSGFRPTKASPELVLVECALTLFITLLALPVAHTHYFALGLFVLPLIAARWAELPERDRRLALVAFALTGPLALLRALDPLVAAVGPVTALNLFKILNGPFIGVIFALVLLVRLHLALSKHEPTFSTATQGARA